MRERREVLGRRKCCVSGVNEGGSIRGAACCVFGGV